MTEAQRRMLRTAADAPRHGWDGVAAKGPSLKTALALERLGYLRDAGIGEECDGDGYSTGYEGPIFEITDAGRAALRDPIPSQTASETLVGEGRDGDGSPCETPSISSTNGERS